MNCVHMTSSFRVLLFMNFRLSSSFRSIISCTTSGWTMRGFHFRFRTTKTRRCCARVKCSGCHGCTVFRSSQSNPTRSSPTSSSQPLTPSAPHTSSKCSSKTTKRCDVTSFSFLSSFHGDVMVVFRFLTGACRWSNRNRKVAGNFRQADAKHAQGVPSGIHHFLGENERQSDARSH